MDLYCHPDSRIIVPTPTAHSKVLGLDTLQQAEIPELYSDASTQGASECQDPTAEIDPESLAADIDILSLASQSTSVAAVDALDDLCQLQPHSTPQSGINGHSNNHSNDASQTGSAIDGSTQRTPPSKVFAQEDVDPETSRRSFSRLKQTGELVNTERVYLASLEILKKDYIDNFMSDVATPVFFETFDTCITRMIESHKALYAKLETVYANWASECLDLQGNDISSQLKSPSFKEYNFVPQHIERVYLDQVVSLLEREAIDVSCYGEYCSLFNRIVSFAIHRGIESYKRNSIAISNDYIVSHRNLQQNIFVDQRLDTRFISVVQMPTNRITRYKLIMGSLLKNIDLDHPPLVTNAYRQAELKLGELVDNVNHYVGEANRKYEQLDQFKTIFDGMTPKLNPKSTSTSYAKLPLPALFMDNLSFINLAGPLTLVYYDENLAKLVHFNSIAAVFDSHLIVGKPSTIYPNKADIVLALPLVAVINHAEIASSFDMSSRFYTLATQYEAAINVTFENNFKIHEVALVFPTLDELTLWTDTLGNALRRISSSLNKFSDCWSFSLYQQRIRQLNFGKEADSFSVDGYVPQGLVPIKTVSMESTEIHLYDVEMFSSKRSSVSSTGRSQLKRESSTSNNAQKSRVVRVTRQERVACQSCLGDLLNPSFTKYQLAIAAGSTLGTLGRSFSTFFFRNEDSEDSEAVVQPPLPFGRGLKKSESTSSFGSFLPQPSIFGYSEVGSSVSAVERSPFKRSTNRSTDVISPLGTPRTPNPGRFSANVFQTPNSLEKRISMQSIREDIQPPISPRTPRTEKPTTPARKRDRIGKILGLGLSSTSLEPPKFPTGDETIRPPRKIPRSSSNMSMASFDSHMSTRSNISNFFKGVMGKKST